MGKLQFAGTLQFWLQDGLAVLCTEKREMAPMEPNSKLPAPKGEGYQASPYCQNTRSDWFRWICVDRC